MSATGDTKQISYPFAENPPYYLLWLFDAFECSDDSYKNAQSKNVSNW